MPNPSRLMCLMCLMLLLTPACAPLPAPVAPSSDGARAGDGGGPATPASLALLALDAQATQQAALVQSTTVARAVVVATEQAAQTTAAWQATLDGHALNVTATADALTAAVAAGQATALAQLSVYSATIAQAHALEAQSRANAAEAQARADLRARADLLALLQTLVGLSLGLTALLTGGAWCYWFWRRQQIKTNAYHHERWALVSQRQAESRRAIAAALRDSILEYDGLRYVPTADGGLTRLLAPPRELSRELSAEKSIGGDPPDMARAAQVRLLLRQLVYNGLDHGGFGERRLVTEARVILNPGDGAPSYAGYRLLSGLLEQMGVWVKPVGKETAWAEGWGPERFEREIALLPLPPLPPPQALPRVLTPLRTPAPPHPRTPAPPPHPGDPALVPA